MQKLKTIYLDMDGVLVDFCRAVDHFFLAPRTWHETEVVEDKYGLTPEEFWKKINTQDFWYNIPYFEHAKYLYGLCKSLADNVVILTTTSGPECSYGKTKSLQEYFGSDVQFAICKDKHVFSHPKTLLIDDRESVVNKFIELGNGGSGMIFPATYNKYGLDIKYPSMSQEHYNKFVDRLLGYFQFLSK